MTWIHVTQAKPFIIINFHFHFYFEGLSKFQSPLTAALQQAHEHWKFPYMQ